MGIRFNIGKTFTTALVFAALFSTPQLHAFIQIETGQLFHQMVDFELTDGKMPLVITRQYQQIKPAKSILGDRWCFDFEQQMVLENGGYRLNACGNPTEVFFKLDGKKMIFGNEKMFEMKFGGLLRRTNKGETLIYNEKGYLVSKARSGSGKYTIKFYYDRENRPSRIVYLDKFSLVIGLDQNGKITGLTSHKKKVVSYTVTNNKLVSEKNVWGLLHQFEYDDSGFMTQIKYPDSTTEKFAYNKKTKTINDYISKEGCDRKFDYQLDTAKSTVNIGIKDSCLKRPPLQITLRKSDLFYKNKKEKRLKQANAKKPRSNLTVTRDQYNRVQRIDTAQGFWKIDYNQETGKMNMITETINNSKSTKTFKVIFKYNKLIEITEPGKAKLNFVYGKKGQLIRIKSNVNTSEKINLMAKIDQIRSIVEESTL